MEKYFITAGKTVNTWLY